MLSSIERAGRERALELFKMFAQRTYGKNIAQWLFESWKYLETNHFKLIEHLRLDNSKQSYEVLQLSLCVQTADISLFTEYATRFAKTPASKVLFDCLKVGKTQPKLQLNEFTSLCSILMLESNIIVVERCKEQLMETPVANWGELIEKTTSTIHLSDKGSVQEGIDEFIHAYGMVEKPFDKDLFHPKSAFGLLLHETKNKANHKQLSLTQYSIGGLRRV